MKKDTTKSKEFEAVIATRVSVVVKAKAKRKAKAAGKNLANWVAELIRREFGHASA